MRILLVALLLVSTSAHAVKKKSESCVSSLTTLKLAMSLIQPGIYWLAGPHDYMVTMFVEVKERKTVNIDVWPGWHVTPQHESFFQQRRIGSFSNSSRVADYYADLEGNTLNLQYRLRFGKGGDSISLVLNENGQLQELYLSSYQGSFSLIQYFDVLAL